VSTAPVAAGPATLSFDGLSVGRDGRPVLHDVSLSIPPGENRQRQTA
jgi:ABC-type molybdenum transport system ATPase subunit/photorepair protein PhrA